MKKALFITLQLFFVVHVAVAQDFITTWSTSNFVFVSEIRFNAQTVGPVNYTWQTIAPAAPASGSGSFVAGNVLIPGLPQNVNVRLAIQPQNFRRFLAPIGTSPFSALLIEINQWGAVPWTTFENAFQVLSFGIIGLSVVSATDTPNLTNVTSLASMFEGCNQLNSPFNLNSWNVSNITNMSKMFAGCFNFNQALSLWNTSNVTNMSSMFEGCFNFNLNIGNWNTANVTNMSSMFKDANNFNRPIGNWNTSNVTNMSEMFALTQFSGGNNFFNQNIGNWNTSSVVNMAGMFRGALNFNQNIGNWNTANVTNMSEMFKGAKVFNQNIGNWNTSNVTNMTNMFLSELDNSSIAQNHAFNNGGSPSIQNWNTANVTNMSGMFQRANNFNQNLGSWALNPAVNLNNMLNSSGMSCSNYSKTLIGWNANPATPNNKILGATFMEFGPEAQAAVNNMTTNKGWGFSGHDLLVINPSFSIQNTVCQGSVAPSLATTSSNGIVGTWLPATINNQNPASYTFTPTMGQCAQPFTLNVAISPVSTPVANANQTFNINSTIANIAITPTNVIWFASAADANADTNPLSASTILVNNATYFAVNTNGQCRSQPVAVTVAINLSNNSFDISFLKVYPNPASSVLQINYTSIIESVEVYSMLGQLLLTSKSNSKTVNIDVSALPSSMYLARIKANDQIGEIKFIKR